MDVVTGAFSYTGRSIARRLLDAGVGVRTLTRRAGSDRLPIESAPLQFADEDALVASLRGARVLYNTYWIRFARGGSTFERAVANSRTLFSAARRAGVARIVHISVTNASEESPLPYFRGKAAVERALRNSGVPYAIVRPTWVFGRDDILVNNLAWLLRRFPLVAIPGDGKYRVQPISVDDVAAVAVAAADASEDLLLDAAGPETLEFGAFVELLRRATGSRARIGRTPPGAALALGTVVGALLRDVLLTRDEVAGLMANLLTSQEPPRGRTAVSEWITASADVLGRRYVSELGRNFRPYAPL